MSAILSEVERVRNLVGGNVVSASLDRILIGICDLLSQHQLEIKELRQQLEDLPSKQDIETAMKLTANKVNEVEEKYNDDHAEFEKAFHSIKREAGNLEKKIQANAQQTDQVIQDFMKKTSDEVNGMSLVYTQQSNDLHDRMQKIEESNTQVTTEFGVIRDMIEQLGVSTVQKLGARLENLDTSIATVHDENQTFATELNTIRSDLARRDLSMRKAVERDLALVQASIRELQDAVFVNPGERENGADIKFGDTFSEELMPIVRSVHRNSRRLDGLNQMISGIRLECENVADTMETSQEVLKQFNHCLYDAGLDIQDVKTEFNTKLRFVTDWIKFTAEMSESMWQAISKLQESHEHLAASTSAGLETAENTIATILARRAPVINTLDEAVLESRTNSEGLLKIRSGHDISKNLLSVTNGLSAVYDESQLRRTKPQPVPKFEKKMPQFGVSSLVQDAIKAPIPVATKNDPMVMLAIEEMRVKTQTLENTIREFTGAVEKRVDTLATEVEAKMGTKEADRVMEKMRRTMEKLQRNVDVVCDTITSSSRTLDTFYMEPRERPKTATDTMLRIKGSRAKRIDLKAATPNPKAKRPVSAAPRSRNRSALGHLASSNVESPRD